MISEPKLLLVIKDRATGTTVTTKIPVGTIFTGVMDMNSYYDEVGTERWMTAECCRELSELEAYAIEVGNKTK